LPAGAVLSKEVTEPFQRAFAERVELLRGALAELGPRALLDTCAERLVTGLTPEPAARIEQLFRPAALAAETLLERTAGAIHHLSRQGDRIVLCVPGGHALEASPRAIPALEQALAANTPFRVCDMHEGLNPTAKLALARHLVSAGLLKIVPPTT